ncbi:hypothetical protein C8Q72DRAFT_841107 [Fomitopsis betulina]|nr:hypothetical protein C8Q72DRAFT_841107 [Fomitopsis betulina]
MNNGTSRCSFTKSESEPAIKENRHLPLALSLRLSNTLATHPLPLSVLQTTMSDKATCANVQANGGSCTYPACGCAEPPKSK